MPAQSRQPSRLDSSPSEKSCDPKGKNGIFSFQRSYNRIKSVIGATTEQQVAWEFGVTRAVVTEYRYARSIPRAWLETLFYRHRVLPMWILFGIEPRFLKPQFSMEAEQVELMLTEAEKALAEAPRSVSVVKVS